MGAHTHWIWVPGAQAGSSCSGLDHQFPSLVGISPTAQAVGVDMVWIGGALPLGAFEVAGMQRDCCILWSPAEKQLSL